MAYQVNDYLKQSFNNGDDLYALIVDRYNNGNIKAMVYDTVAKGKAKQSSIMNPDLWRKIDQSEIPTKILFKLHERV